MTSFDGYLADRTGSDLRRLLRPPPKLSVSEWADRYYMLSPESSAVPGRWTTLPYQREPLDAMGDPSLQSVALMKSARVGYTRMLLALIGYHMHQDPAPCLVIQPTIDDAKGFSKDDLQPMIRDTPVLTKIVHEDADAVENTMREIHYPGGMVSLIGANTGTGLRRISRKVILADEVDAFPVLIGEGDVIKLAQKRSEYYHDRRFSAGSTPLIAGISRIEQMFNEGDARRYYVPCAQCEHMAPLVFRGDAGHRMEWPRNKPQEAFFSCQQRGCVIEHTSKRWMVERGEWRPTKAGLPGHRSYHMWAALSYSPGATWGHIASEFVAAHDSPERLRVFVNTTLGETWKERGDAPDWEKLYARREHYQIGVVPAGVRFLTCGVDVQKDRFIYEVVGWGDGKQSWSVDADVLMVGDTSLDSSWTKLDDLLNRAWLRVEGGEMAILCLAVDSGYNTNQVYSWARRHPLDRVVATKGVAKQTSLVSTASAVDVTVRGQKIQNGYKVWPVGVNVGKSELYGWLRHERPGDGEQAPGGYCHFPEYPQDFFKQMTAEHMVPVVTTKGYTELQWHLQPGRENHWLDCRVYARAAAAIRGLDRQRWSVPPTPVVTVERAPTVVVPQGAPEPKPKAPKARSQSPDSSFWGRRDKRGFWK